MKQVENIGELKKKQYLLYIIILLVLLVAMLTYTLVFCISHNKEYSFFKGVEAEVISHDTIDGVVYDVVEYSVDGVVYRNTTSVISKNDIGDIVTIYYDENNPIGIVTKLDSKRWILPTITLIYGVATASLTVLYFVNYYGKTNKLKDKKVKTIKVKDETAKEHRVDNKSKPLKDKSTKREEG